MDLLGVGGGGGGKVDDDDGLYGDGHGDRWTDDWVYLIWFAFDFALEFHSVSEALNARYPEAGRFG